MIHILDTDVFTIAQLPDSPAYQALHARVMMLSREDQLVTTIVTYEEQTRGWLAYAAKSRQTGHQIRAYTRLKSHLLAYRDFEVLNFDAPAGTEFDRLRAAKPRIGTSDLKIAAIALAHDGVLLTRNLRDFGQIPNLRAEDWTRP